MKSIFSLLPAAENDLLVGHCHRNLLNLRDLLHGCLLGVIHGLLDGGAEHTSGGTTGKVAQNGLVDLHEENIITIYAMPNLKLYTAYHFESPVKVKAVEGGVLPRGLHDGGEDPVRHVWERSVIIPVEIDEARLGCLEDTEAFETASHFWQAMTALNNLQIIDNSIKLSLELQFYGLV